MASIDKLTLITDPAKIQPSDTIPLSSGLLGDDVRTSLSNAMVSAFSADDNPALNAKIKALYEANLDTNAFTDDEKVRVAIIRQSRDATSAQALADNLLEGQVGMMAGYFYQKRAAATGVTSATNDLGVDGLVPYGPFVYAAQFGAVSSTSVALAAAATAAQDAVARAITYAGSYFATGSPTAYPMQVDSLPVVLEGIVRFTDTCAPSTVRVWPRIMAMSAGSAGILWDYTGMDDTPIFDLGSGGANAQFINLKHWNNTGATLPSYIIETTSLTDYGFSIEGSDFWEAEYGLLKADSFTNLFLKNFKFGGSNKTMLEFTNQYGGPNRQCVLRDWTIHGRDAGSVGGTDALAMQSFVDITFEAATGAYCTVVMSGQRIEMDNDAFDGTNFDLIKVAGTPKSTHDPCISLVLEDGGFAFNFGAPACATSLIYGALAVANGAMITLRNFELDGLTTIVRGNITGTWPAASEIAGKTANWSYATGAQAAYRHPIQKLIMGTSATQTTLTVTGNAIDLSGVIAPVLVLSDGGAPTNLTTISNGQDGQEILIRSASSSTITVASGGNITVGVPGTSFVLDSNAFIRLVKQPGSGQPWRLEQSRNLVPTSFILPSYTDAGKPATGTAGQAIYVSDGDAGAPAAEIWTGSGFDRLLFGETQDVNVGATGNFFSDGVGPGSNVRLAERIMIGDSRDFACATDGNNGSTHSWLEDVGDGTADLSYFETSGRVVSTTSFGIAASFGSRTTVAGVGTQAIGIAAIGYNDADSTSKSTWGAYIEGGRNRAGGGYAHGAEIEVFDEVGDITDILKPSGAPVAGMVMGLTVGSGADTTVHPTTFPATVAIRIEGLGNTFRSGIVFRDDALEAWTDTVKRAVLMPTGASVSWFDASNLEQLRIHSSSSGAGNEQSVEFNNSGVSFKNDVGNPFLFINNGPAGGAPNYLQITAVASGSAPSIASAGSDTNIDLTLTPKGTGNVRFGTLTANADAPVTGYITIKDAGGTARKLAVIA